MKFTIINRESNESIELNCDRITVIGRGVFGVRNQFHNFSISQIFLNSR